MLPYIHNPPPGTVAATSGGDSGFLPPSGRFSNFQQLGQPVAPAAPPGARVGRSALSSYMQPTPPRADFGGAAPLSSFGMNGASPHIPAPGQLDQAQLHRFNLAGQYSAQPFQPLPMGGLSPGGLSLGALSPGALSSSPPQRDSDLHRAQQEHSNQLAEMQLLQQQIQEHQRLTQRQAVAASTPGRGGYGSDSSYQGGGNSGMDPAQGNDTDRPSSAESSISHLMAQGFEYGVDRPSGGSGSGGGALSGPESGGRAGPAHGVGRKARAIKSAQPVKHEKPFYRFTMRVTEKDRMKAASYVPQVSHILAPSASGAGGNEPNSRHVKNRGSASAPGGTDARGAGLVGPKPATADRWPLKTGYAQAQEFPQTANSEETRDVPSYASKRGREVEYKPYTLKDFQRLKAAQPHKLGSLGPDMADPERRERAERLKRLKNYGSKVRAVHREHVPAPIVPKREPKDPEPSRFERITSYAKTVPKPRLRPAPPEVTRERSRPTELEVHTPIEAMELKHRIDLETVARIRQEFF